MGFLFFILVILAANVGFWPVALIVTGLGFVIWLDSKSTS